MEQTEKKNALVRAMAEIECYPIAQEEVKTEEYSKIPIGQLSSLGAAFTSIAPALQKVASGAGSSGVGGDLYRMIDPLNGLGRITSVGNIYQEGKRGVAARARYIKVDPSEVGKVAQLDPTVMLIAIAISAITQKLDRIEEAQKDIIEFLQLKEKAVLKGNIAVLQEMLEEYKYNWDNEKYKNNKHIQVQEIKRDAEQSIIFCREKIEKRAAKKGFLHSDRDVKSKIQKVLYEFKDYELAMYIFAFSSFLEVMLLENFDSGYLSSITKKIEAYSEQYRELHKKCYELVEGDSKTSVQAYLLKGVAGLNKALGKGIAKIPKISDGQVDEALIGAGERVDSFSEKRTQSTMELFAREECFCVRPFVDNIDAVNRIYNEPMEMLFDSENIYYKLKEANAEDPA